MNRSYYLELAARGLRMPVGAHLVLHEQPDPDAVLLDGARLGAVIIQTAERYHTPLALPLMDLTLEKSALLQACGVPAAEADAFHFDVAPPPPASIAPTPRMHATCRALTHVARHPGLLPIGMAIGPFSLMTKLVADPITPVYLAGSGITADDDPDVALIERALALGEQAIHGHLLAQIEAGARAIMICEPAANQVYLSPTQMESNPAVFEHFVMEPMQRLARLLDRHGVDLIFHDCGELTDAMVRRFATLGAAMISFGSSRKLWEDAALVPKDTVLFGNLPSKFFYAKNPSAADVAALAQDLLVRMRAAGHPFILGSECDVLSMSGHEAEIRAKIDAFMSCRDAA